MNRILTYTITEDEDGLTLGDFLKHMLHFTDHQISSLKFMEDGLKVNGQRCRVTRILHKEDVAEIRLDTNHETEKQVDTRADYAADQETQWERPESGMPRLKIIYEDEDLLAVDKAAGVVCHPAHGHYRDTLANQVAWYLYGQGVPASQKTVTGPVYLTARLDMDTTGVVLFAKNAYAAADIARQREAGTCEKLYLAEVQGDNKSVVNLRYTHDITSGTITTPVTKEIGELNRMKTVPAEEASNQVKAAMAGSQVTEDDAEAMNGLKSFAEQSSRPMTSYSVMAAETSYKVISKTSVCVNAFRHHLLYRCLLECRIHHGRTHQIRVHMASMGYPIIGDGIYGASYDSNSVPNDSEAFQRYMADYNELTGDGLHLHAWKMKFRKPFTRQEVVIEAPAPQWAAQGLAGYGRPDVGTQEAGGLTYVTGTDD